MFGQRGKKGKLLIKLYILESFVHIHNHWAKLSKDKDFTNCVPEKQVIGKQTVTEKRHFSFFISYGLSCRLIWRQRLLSIKYWTMTEEDYYVFQMMILTTQFLKICRQFLFNINSLNTICAWRCWCHKRA